jgi:hypothetical protein
LGRTLVLPNNGQEECWVYWFSKKFGRGKALSRGNFN